MFKVFILIIISSCLLQSCKQRHQSNPDYDLNFTTYNSFIEHYERIYKAIYEDNIDDIIKTSDDLLYISSAFKEIDYIHEIAKICGVLITKNDIHQQKVLFHELNIQMNKLQQNNPYFDTVQLNSNKNEQYWLSTNNCRKSPY